MLKLFLFLNLANVHTYSMFVLCSMDESSDTDPVGFFFFSICLTHFSLWPRPTVSFPKHMCGDGGIGESLSHGTCWHRLWIWHWALLLCTSSSCCMSSPMPATVVLTFVEVGPYKGKKCSICSLSDIMDLSLTSLRQHHDSSHSLLNLPNNYSHFLLFSTDQTLTWTSEWLHYLCGSLQSGKQREVGESIFFFQVVCVSRWDGITAQNQGPTGECGVWGTYGQTGCWRAAYTSFS